MLFERNQGRETNKLTQMVWKPEVYFRRSTLQRCSHDIGMLQTNLAEMEGGGEIIVADRPDTLRATTLALAQRGQFHSYAKNSQTIAQDRRLHVFVTERTDIVVLALEKTIEAFTLGITKFDPGRRVVEKNSDIEHTLPQLSKYSDAAGLSSAEVNGR